MNKQAKEAQPILKRDQHFFKIVTLYVVDRNNFEMQKHLRNKEKSLMQTNFTSQNNQVSSIF
jgi:hypothetical protein